MADMVEFWVDEFIKEGKDAKDEIEEVECAISNERLWQKGSRTSEDAEVHEQNIEELEEYLGWLKDRAAGAA